MDFFLFLFFPSFFSLFLLLLFPFSFFPGEKSSVQDTNKAFNIKSRERKVAPRENFEPVVSASSLFFKNFWNAMFRCLENPGSFSGYVESWDLFFFFF